MGLAMSVGMLADQLRYDPEGAAWIRRWLAAANAALAAEGLPQHDEPETFPRGVVRPHLASFPYSWAWNLRRAVAYAFAGEPLSPLAPGQNPGDDPVLEEELCMFSSHVLSVSGTQGLFVPADFRHPLVAPGVPGEMLGSSQAALRDLVRTAPLLGIDLVDGALSDATAAELFTTKDGDHPLWIERRVWHTFFELARASVEHKTALILH